MIYHKMLGKYLMFNKYNNIFFIFKVMRNKYNNILIHLSYG